MFIFVCIRGLSYFRVMIQRTLFENIQARLFTGKAIIVLGPRQTGKTTLVSQICPRANPDAIWLSGDDANDRMRLQNVSLPVLNVLLGKKKFLVIDEAQRIGDIGVTMKLITDNIPEIQVIATGSSALELANSINEPLTGRKHEYTLYPLSFSELSNHTNAFEETGNLENRLIYGSYPEVVANPGDEREILSSLSDSYLYKDLLAYDKIKKPELLVRLLQALALQMGSEVSYHELGQITGADKETIERYIDALEKTFVVFRLRSFSRNVRNELKKSRKIYFYDNGIRNAILGNYAPINSRSDRGALFENYIITERWKTVQYHKKHHQRYFWRTTQQQEIDYLELYDGELDAFEIKWNMKSKYKLPLTFSKNYPVRQQQVIHPGNYAEWLLQGETGSMP